MADIAKGETQSDVLFVTDQAQLQPIRSAFIRF